MQDTDSSVRDAATESVASIAAGLAGMPAPSANGAPQSPLTPSTPIAGLVNASNPGTPVGGVGGSGSSLMRMLMDCLVEQKRELNAAACVALGLVSVCSMVDGKGQHRFILCLNLGIHAVCFKDGW